MKTIEVTCNFTRKKYFEKVKIWGEKNDDNNLRVNSLLRQSRR